MVTGSRSGPNTDLPFIRRKADYSGKAAIPKASAPGAARGLLRVSQPFRQRLIGWCYPGMASLLTEPRTGTEWDFHW